MSRVFRVIDGKATQRRGECHWCKRALGTSAPVRVTYIYITEPVDLGEMTLKPGWHCATCLERAHRSDPPA